ncbi:hypothetical protein FRC17_000318 [Serendipita sp. 399]|nr:hypothetical protein FRC17_000318 [Serendipita sp. 399]
MRLINIITYITLASVTAVFALPVHPAQRESTLEKTTGIAVAHHPHDSHDFPETVAGASNLPLSKEVQTKDLGLTKRDLNTGPLSAQGHAAERGRHLEEQQTHERMSGRYHGAAVQANAAFKAESAKQNPDQRLLRQHSKATNYNVAKSMEMSERAKANGAGAAYHGAMHTAAQIAAVPRPNQHDAAALQRAHQAASGAAQAHAEHTAAAETHRGQAIMHA